MDSLDPDALVAHGEFLRRLARGMLHDEHAAEDVVQSAYAAALEEPGAIRSVGGWLRGVVVRLSHRSLRAKKRRGRREAAVARPEGVPAVVDAVARLEVHRRVVQEVLSLAEPGRTAIVLRYYDGLGPTEIARRLDCPVRTVESRLRRAHEELRARLDGTYGSRRAWAGAFASLGAFGGSVAAKTKTVGLAVAALVLLAGGGAAAWVLTSRSSDDRSRSTLAEALPTTRRPSDATLPLSGVKGLGHASGEADGAEGGAGLRGRERPRPQGGNAPSIDVIGREVTGIVVNERGAPIAGAEIVRLLDEDATSTSESPRKAFTDREGRFRFAVQRPEVVRAHAPGLATRGGTVRVSWDEPATIVLVPARTIDVQVADAGTRQGIGGARVTAFFGGRFGALSDDVPAGVARTDAQGRARLELAEDDRDVGFVVAASGYAPVLAMRSARSDQAVVVAMSRGGTIEGRVLDPEGRPLPSVELRAAGHPRWRASTTTAADGTFRVVGVPGSVAEGGFTPLDPRIELLVEPSDGPPEAAPVNGPRAGVVARATVRLRRWRTVRGRVLDANREPVAGVFVRFEAVYLGYFPRAFAARGRGVETTADGSFGDDSVHPTATKIEVSTAKSHTIAVRDVQIPAEGPVPDVEIVLDAATSRTGDVRVQVLDGNGVPVPEARAATILPYGGARTSTGDAQGIVTLEGVPLGRIAVSFGAPKGVASVAWIDAGAGKQPVPLHLGTGVVEGRLLRGEDAGVVGVVALTAVIGPDPSFAEAGSKGAAGESPQTAFNLGASVRTDDSGRFRFAQLGDGDYRMSYRADSGGPTWHGPGPTWQVVSERVRAGDHDVRVYVDGGPGRPPAFEVVVRGPGGEPVTTLPLPRLEFRSSDGGMEGSLLLEHHGGGVYVPHETMSPLSPNEYELVLEPGAGYRNVPLGRHRVGTPGLRLQARLSRGPRVDGIVRDTKGEPLFGVEVRIQWTSSDEDGPTRTGPDGRFTFAGVPNDDVTVVVSGDHVVTKEVPVATGGNATTVDIVVHAAGSLDVSFRDERRPKTSWTLYAVEKDGERERLVHVSGSSPDDTEPFRVGGIAPGRRHLSLVWDEETYDLGPIEIVAGKTVPLVIGPP